MASTIGSAVLARLGMLVAAAVFAFPPDVLWVSAMRADETLAAARLTAAEERAIVGQLEASSFDEPESWATELRVRRIRLGNVDALLIRGSDRLCGATGNCQTWIFRRARTGWLNAFVSEAPVAASVGVGRAPSSMNDVVLTANSSAENETWTRYRFERGYYRAVECFAVRGGVGRATPCR